MLNKPTYSHGILMVCFLLSGAAGLMYEVVWSRQLTLFVGITTYAHTAVITAYMLGLALGSYVLGRYSDRHASPFRLLAMLEAGIAAYAALSPWLIQLLQYFYSALAGEVGVAGAGSHLLRFFIVILLLLPPTCMMGGTLPVMIRGMTGRLPELARVSGKLYGINTLGAMLGTMVAGYVLLPQVGLRATLYTGAALDVLVAAIFFTHSRCVNVSTGDTTPAAIQPATPAAFQNMNSRNWMLVLFGVSGFAAMAYQIAWIRALTLVLGSSVYSFSTTLAAFLCGIGLGSLMYRFLPGGDNDESRHGQAALITGLTAFCAISGLWVTGRLPEFFLWGYHHGWNTHFAIFQLYLFALCFLVMLVPTLLLGAMFPLMATLWTCRFESAGRDIGTLYAANTAGCIAGTMAAGLMFIPVMGVHGTVMLAAGLHILVGLGFGWKAPRKNRNNLLLPASAGVVVLYGLFVVFMPPWDKAMMTSGVFNYANTMIGPSPRQSLLESTSTRAMLYYKDGRDGTVSVLENSEQRMLAINGKIDATSKGDLPTQIMLGKLPMLAHAAPRNILLIGLGSGITASEVAMNSSVERIDIVEISPEVVEASRVFFSDANHHVLEDARVRVVIADARNFLLASDRRYDVIISEPSNPWISGVANLFTRDFFQLMQARLAPGGLACQWFHIYNMSPRDTASVMGSYHAVFPHTSAWISMNSDLIMLGSEQPHALDAMRVRQEFDRPDKRVQLRSIGMHNLANIGNQFLFKDDVLGAFCAGVQLNTDDRPVVEFSAPRHLYRQTSRQTMAGIVTFLAGNTSVVPVGNLAHTAGDRLESALTGIAITPAYTPIQNEWTASYRNRWSLFPSDDHTAADLIGVGGQILITWKDGFTQNDLKTIYQKENRTLDQMKEYLHDESVGPWLAEGEVDLPGGVRGVWLLSKSSSGIKVKFCISWCVPSPQGGCYQHIAERELDDPGAQAWGPSLVSFARCFNPIDQAAIP